MAKILIADIFFMKISAYNNKGISFDEESTAKRLLAAVQEEKYIPILKDFRSNWIFNRTDVPPYLEQRISLLSRMMQTAMSALKGTKMFTFLCEQKPFRELVQANPQRPKHSFDTYHSYTPDQRQQIWQEIKAYERAVPCLEGALKIFPQIVDSCVKTNRIDCFEILCQKAHEIATYILIHSNNSSNNRGETTQKPFTLLMRSIIGTPFYPLFREKVMVPNQTLQRTKGLTERFDQMHAYVEQEMAVNPNRSPDLAQKQRNEAMARFMSLRKIEQQMKPLTDRIEQSLQASSQAFATSEDKDNKPKGIRAIDQLL